MSSALDSSIALVTTTALNNYLGITSGSTEETETDLMINAASQLALTWTGRTTLLLSTALAETYQGDNSQDLWLYSYPVTAVSEVYIDVTGKFTSSNGYIVDATNYNVITRGKIALIGGVFLKGVADTDSIKVTYSAGYSTVPYDLQQAVKELVAYWYGRETGRRVGVRSNTAGDTSISYESDVPQAVATIFNRYRNFMRRVM